MVEKSMLDVAYNLIVGQGKPVSFKDIWERITKEIDQATPERMSRFYTNLTLDGRFVALGGNMWDLRTNYTFKELYEDIRGVFRDVEEVEEEKEIDPFEEPEEEELLEPEEAVVDEEEFEEKEDE
ncbi:MAG: DNA-directed RNA polymerase subunit delta [Bacilli bacterium]|jgi:DNA-directed RNA polymerase subunit delta